MKFGIKPPDYSQIWDSHTDLPPDVAVLVPEGLRPYQTIGVQFAEQAAGRVFVGDDPGSGKTVITLGWIHHNLSSLKHVLIVAPTVVVYKWQKEIKQWLDMPSSVVDRLVTPISSDCFQIMSYTMMRMRWEELVSHQWDLVVFDEAHHIKNPKAQQTKVARKIARKTTYRIMLSGKPFLNHLGEMWYPLNIMNQNAFPNWFRFMTEYTNGRGYHWTGLRNVDKLRKQLAPHMIRRTKKEVISELPELQRVALPFRLDEETLFHYMEDETRALEAPNALAAATILRQSVGKAKAMAAVDWAIDFLDQSDDEKLVIYVHYLAVMDFIRKSLDNFGVDVINGSVPAKNRQEKAIRFQEDPALRVLIINTAANEGIDLYAASNILFAEREWVPNTEEQAEGRLHRIGQKNGVVAWYILAMDTFDEHLDAVINGKRELFSSVMKSDDVQTSVIHDVLAILRSKRRDSGKRVPGTD